MKVKFDEISAGTPCYNGNISSLTWENAEYGQKRGYRFTYDHLNRMANAAYGERDDLSDNAGHYDETLEYDTNGNITGLQRSGLKQDGQYGKIDNLHLSYNGNQLVVIKEDAEPILYEGAFGLNEKGEHRLAYNGCGALQSDETRGIAMIEYDACNHPRRIQFTNGNVTKYVYTPDGRKLRTIHNTAMPNIKVEVGQVHPLTAGEILSSDSIDYMMGGKLITKNGRIDKYLFEGGYCQAIGGQTHLAHPSLILWDDEDSNPSPSDYEQWRKTFESWEAAMKAERERDQFLFYYYNRDHLGNIREVVDDNGNVVQVNNYYPFGSPYCDTSASKAPELQPYKYNGKELDLMHGLNTYDYDARQYNPVVPIWDRVDPLCEKYYNTSPYAYCHDNPVNAVDPDGRELRLFHDAYELVIGTLPIEEREFIRINDNGFIRKDILAKAVNSDVASQNLQYLNMIVQDERIIDYYGSVSEARVRYDASGKGNFQNTIIRFQAPTRGSDVDLLVESAIAGGSILPIDKLREIYIKQGHSTEYTVQGNLGLTVRPAEMQGKYPNLGQQALSKNIEVYTSSVDTTKLDRILNAGHELYSHVAFYLEEKDGRHDGTMNDALNMRESQVRYDILRYNCNLK